MISHGIGTARAVTSNQLTELNEQAVKILRVQHDDWMKHPGTVLFIALLNKRLQDYDYALVKHIREKSDKEFEDKQRVAMNTCRAILQLAQDQELFIKHSTKQ